MRGWLAWVVCGTRGHEWAYWGGGLMYCERCTERRAATHMELAEHEGDEGLRGFYEAYGPTG